jgi:transcriptional regulator with XRE-family HTH domain
MISRYENNQVNPSIIVAAQLARVLNTSVGHLMGETRFPEDPELESIFKDVLTVPESEQTKIKNTLISLLKVTKAEFLGSMMSDSKPDSSPK